MFKQTFTITNKHKVNLRHVVRATTDTLNIISFSMIYLSAPRNVLVREITSEKDLTTNHGGEIIYGQGRFTMRQAPRAPTKILMRFRKWTFLLRKSLRTFNSCNVVDRPFTNPN